MARFILIEGIDGAGKTTLADKLAKKEGYRIVEKPNSPEPADIVKNADFYALIDSLDSDTIWILDRYLPTEIAYESARGNSVVLWLGRYAEFLQKHEVEQIWLFRDLPESGEFSDDKLNCDYEFLNKVQTNYASLARLFGGVTVSLLTQL